MSESKANHTLNQSANYMVNYTIKPSGNMAVIHFSKPNVKTAKKAARAIPAFLYANFGLELYSISLYAEVNVGNIEPYWTPLNLDPVTAAEIRAEEKAIADLDSANDDDLELKEQAIAAEMYIEELQGDSTNG